MKKIVILILSGGLLLFSINSCDDYLKVDHTDILSIDYVYNSEETAEEGLVGCYDCFYPDRSSNNEISLASWGFKPQFMLAGHPTLDTQASGWDAAYCSEDWTSSSSEFLQIWEGHFMAISRCNSFLSILEEMDNSLFTDGEDGKKLKEAQARAIRAWNYMALAENFGRLPMLSTGETDTNTPNKARAETIDETWEAVIEDFKYAAEILDWTPLNGEYGRITKGFCLGYLAKVYMYKEKYSEAKTLLKQIIDRGTYELVKCYSYLFDPEAAWQIEDVFAIPMYTDYGSDATTNGLSPDEDHYLLAAYNTASMEYGGWGSLFISWECYGSFEEGDKRRTASMVALGETNPWTGQTIGKNGAPYVKTGSEFMPNISSLKYWKINCDNSILNAPMTLHVLRYSNVLLDYAECCFQTGTDEVAAWDAIAQIRNRAWGNLEVELNDPDYEIPLQTETVEVPDAKTYYNTYKADKGYSTDVGILAVNMERRHEYVAEWTLYYDLKRTGMLDEFIELEYPQNTGSPSGQSTVDDGHGNMVDAAFLDKRTYRTFTHNSYKNLFPIPYQEILTNDEISAEDQNPGY